MKTLPFPILPFQKNILDWYHANKRYMPWREDPTPYHVWISEIMLQQTRVEAVREYYARFIETLPDIYSLSQVEDDVLHKLWEGLGYYNRAKNLKKAAQQIITDFGGELPNTYNELIRLPGIGPYTAGAIASIAFRQPLPAVDGNVMRVIARITGDDSDITENKTKQAMTNLVQQIIPVTEVHHFNQALMELGAIICLPNGEPKCSQCPMSTMCIAYHAGTQNELPVKKKKNARKIEEKTILLFVDDREHVLIQKREQKGLLHGLWEFPSLSYSVSLEECQSLFAPISASIKKIVPLPSSKHIFTHIEWKMNGYFVFLNDKKTSDIFRTSLLPTISELYLSSDTVWATKEELQKVYPIPTAFRTYRNALEETGRQVKQLNLFDGSL